MTNQRTIYIISGPLGVGKTTLAKQLVHKLKNGVLIEGDSFLNATEKITKFSWNKRLILAWNSILTTTLSYLKEDLDIVIDFVVEDELKWFVENTKKYNTQIKYIVLIANKETLKNRLQKRGETQYLKRSITLLDKLSNNPLNNKFIFDTTDKNTSEIIEKILHNDNYIVGKILNDLARLINFGADTIENSKLKRGVNQIDDLVIDIVSAVHNYSESIWTLLDSKNGRTHAVEVLLRPIYESMINLKWVLLASDESHAHKFVFRGNNEEIKKLQKILKFLTKNQKSKTINNTLSIEQVKKRIQLVESENERIPKLFQKNMPDRIDRIKAIDKNRQSKKDSFEWMDLVVFSSLSDMTHLGTQGLSLFSTRNQDGSTTIDLSGDPSQVEMLARLTYVMYLEVIERFIIKFTPKNTSHLKGFIDIGKKISPPLSK